MELKVVESIFPETVRQVLKKRHQTLVEADVVHSRACECGLRVPDGNGKHFFMADSSRLDHNS